MSGDIQYFIRSSLPTQYETYVKLYLYFLIEQIIVNLFMYTI